MLGEHAGDVVVDHHHLVHPLGPRRREHADGGRAAADPHPRLDLTVHHRRLAGGDDDARAAVDGELHRLAVAQLQHRLAGDVALLLAAAGEMADAADRQHLRAVLGRRDVADRLALGAHCRRFRAEVAVGIDLQLDAAVAEDALGDDGDHVDAVVGAGGDERRRLVIGVGGAGADAGDELVERPQQPPFLPVRITEERHHRAVARGGPLDHDQRINAGEDAGDVGVAVAGAGLTWLDPAAHRAGVADDQCRGRVRPSSGAHPAPAGAARIAARTRSGVAGTRRMVTPVA